MRERVHPNGNLCEFKSRRFVGEQSRKSMGRFERVLGIGAGQFAGGWLTSSMPLGPTHRSSR